MPTTNNQKSLLNLALAGLLTAFAWVPGSTVVAQTGDETSTKQTKDVQPEAQEDQASEDQQLSIEEQKAVAKEVYGLTKTATTAKQLTAMIEKCDKAAEAGLNRKYETYIRNLKAWALNRRGERRFEVAKQLQSIGNVAQYQKAFDDAITDFNDSLSIDTSRHRTFNSRGIAFLFDGQLVEAAKDFTKAVGCKADFTAGYFNRAEALSAMKKFDLAIKDYDTALSLQPNDPQTLTGRGHAFLALGKTDLAMKDYNQIVSDFGDDAVALINRGDCYQQAGDWKKSIDDYEAAKKLGNKDVADQRIAWVLATASDDSVRDPAKALALIAPCVNQSSSPTVAMLETLAAAQAAEGNFAEAQKSQSRVLKLTGETNASDSNVKTASAEEPVAAPSASEARMALYEQEKPFVQKTDK